MKSFIFFVLFVLITFLSFYFPNHQFEGLHHTKTVEVGPYQPFTWTSGRTASFHGDSFVLKSDNYFEIHQGNEGIQAVLEKPELGSTKGRYWIRDQKLTGDWDITSSADIFSLEDTTIEVTPNKAGIASDRVIANILGLIIWIVAMLVYLQIATFFI